MDTFFNDRQQGGFDVLAHVNAVDITDRPQLGVRVVVELCSNVFAFDAHWLCGVEEKPPRAGALGESRAGVMSTGGGMVGGGHLGGLNCFGGSDIRCIPHCCPVRVWTKLLDTDAACQHHVRGLVSRNAPRLDPVFDVLADNRTADCLGQFRRAVVEFFEGELNARSLFHALTFANAFAVYVQMRLLASASELTEKAMDLARAFFRLHVRCLYLYRKYTRKFTCMMQMHLLHYQRTKQHCVARCGVINQGVEQMATTTAAPLQIKHRYTGAALFEYESGLTMHQALEKATDAKADLGGAYLGGADLRGAYLGGAYLDGADLDGADLGGAYLGGAYLGGAYLRGKKLVGDRPFFSIGPIGSRSDNLLAFITDSGVMIRAGCFFDTRAKFELQLASTHGDNQHAQEYRAALVLIDKHAELWTPKVDAVEPVAEVQS